MMYFKRIFFVISSIFFSFFLWNFFHLNIFINKNNLKINNFTSQILNNNFSDNKNQLINIQNDVLSLDVNLLGGNIEHATLLKYKNHVNTNSPFVLLKNKKKFIYRIVDGFLKRDNFDFFFKRQQPIYTVESVLYKLKPGKKKIKVFMNWKSVDNILYTKIISLKRGSYSVDIEYIIHNNSNKTIYQSIFGEIQQTIFLPKKNSFLNNFFNIKSYTGTAFSSDKKNYQKHSFDDIFHKKNINLITRNGWIAMLQKYFLTAWIPKFIKKYMIYSNCINKNIAVIGFISPEDCINPNSVYKVSSCLWIGPNIQNKLSYISKNLESTIDYGLLNIISYPLFKLLVFFYSIFHNWGITIIVITCLIRIIIYPLTKLQYISVLKMKSLNLKVQTIKKKYHSDFKKQNRKILSLYSFNKISPVSGFFSFIIQTPIFLSFYYVLVSSIELRHSPFFLWIHDLSSYDSYYILPFFMGFSIFLTQSNSLDFKDVFEKKNIMCFMPLLSTIFFLWLPSGLIIYYITNNLITFFQQWFISINFVNKDI
ncbi:Membrane protein insertase YidC [Buchnera aphidicola (Cinara curtihirsuta)]|nr:Membrane protein insertase YidC [Buchnera aphidicola (Cinara curtihirsuta)]